jgi:hypothetical protein
MLLVAVTAEILIVAPAAAVALVSKLGVVSQVLRMLLVAVTAEPVVPAAVKALGPMLQAASRAAILLGTVQCM